MSTFNPFEAHYDTINDKDDFNIGNTSRNYTIDPLETEAERNLRTRTVYVKHLSSPQSPFSRYFLVRQS